MFDAVFEQTAVGMVLSTSDGKWLRVNRKLRDILGYSETEAARLGFADVLQAIDFETLLGHFSQLETSQITAGQYEAYLICKNGSTTAGIITTSLILSDEIPDPCFLTVIEHIGRRPDLIRGVYSSHPNRQIVHTQEAWLRAIFENAPIEIVLKDIEGRIVAISGNVAKDLGYDANDIIGKTVADFLPKHIADVYIAADRKVIESGLPSQQEVKEEIEGSVRNSLSSKFPLRDDDGIITGICSLTTDITELKRSEDALRKANERLEKMVRQLDHDKTILATINTLATDLIAIPSREELAWYLAREVVSQLGFVDCVIYFMDETGTLLRQYAAIGETKNPKSNEIINRLDIAVGTGITGQVAQTKEPLIIDDLDKDDRYIEDIDPARSEICVPLLIAGRIVGVIDCEDPRVAYFNEHHLKILSTVAAIASAKLKLIEQDLITTMAKDELSRTLEELELRVEERTKDLTEEIIIRKQAEEEAAAANLAKSEFLSSMSHELRTPMNAILGFSQLLENSKKEPLSDKQRTYVKHIITGGEHLLELIDQVLDLARIETGEVDTTNTRIDLSELCQQCISMVEKTAQQKGLTIHQQLAKNRYIETDYIKLKQALLNLLSNAVKYNRVGGMITLSNDETVDDRVRISVTDTGNGIAPEFLSRVFNPFDRLGRESSNIEGTGIGLTIAKKLIESIGGQIGFETESGKGTSFWLELPASPGSI